MPSQEAKITELIMRYVHVDQLDALKSERILMRLCGNVAALLKSATLLRLFSVFLGRRNLQVPLPIDVICRREHLLGL